MQHRGKNELTVSFLYSPKSLLLLLKPDVVCRFINIGSSIYDLFFFKSEYCLQMNCCKQQPIIASFYEIPLRCYLLSGKSN